MSVEKREIDLRDTDCQRAGTSWHNRSGDHCLVDSSVSAEDRCRRLIV